METFKGPYRVFTHGNIGENYFNSFDKVGFLNFGFVEYSNIRLPSSYWVNQFKHTNKKGDAIFTNATVKFPNGIILEKVSVYVNVNKYGSSEVITVLPNVMTIWNALKASQHTHFVIELENDANINCSMYSRIKSDATFCSALSSLGINKEISMHELFNSPIAKGFYLWTNRIGLSHNNLLAKFSTAGRKAEETLIKHYIETEKVYRTDPLRDKIDDSLHLMNKNGDKLRLQLWYFNNRQ